MEPLKPFYFFLPSFSYDFRVPETTTLMGVYYQRTCVGLIYTPHKKSDNLAPVRVAFDIITQGSRQTKILKNRFLSVEDAKAWCLQHQAAIFDQYDLYL